MSSMPLISHRMLVAAMAQECRIAVRNQADEPSPAPEVCVPVEVIDPNDWTDPTEPVTQITARSSEVY